MMSASEAFMIEKNMFTEDQALELIIKNKTQILGDTGLAIADLTAVNNLRIVINAFHGKDIPLYNWVAANWEELEQEYGCFRVQKKYHLSYRAILYIMQENNMIKYVDETPTESDLLTKLIVERANTQNRVNELATELLEWEVRLDKVNSIFERVKLINQDIAEILN